MKRLFSSEKKCFHLVERYFQQNWKAGNMPVVASRLVSKLFRKVLEFWSSQKNQFTFRKPICEIKRSTIDAIADVCLFEFNNVEHIRVVQHKRAQNIQPLDFFWGFVSFITYTSTAVKFIFSQFFNMNFYFTVLQKNDLFDPECSPNQIWRITFGTKKFETNGELRQNKLVGPTDCTSMSWPNYTAQEP